MGKGKKKHQKKPKFYTFGMGAIQGLKLPQIDKSPDSNWKELEKELKISEKYKTLKKKSKKRKFIPKRKTSEIISEKSTAPSSDHPANETKKETSPEDTADSTQDITNCIAIDCEMVGVGIEGKEHMLARCSIVNAKCEKIYDKFVQPREEVVDYRYALTGIKQSDLATGDTFEVVQKEVSDIIMNRVLIGHTLRCDLKVLLLDHPRFSQRDVSTYKPLTKKTERGRPGLKLMSKIILDKKIQEGHHDSVEDAVATMQLYLLERKEWERRLERKRKNSAKH